MEESVEEAALALSVTCSLIAGGIKASRRFTLPGLLRGTEAFAYVVPAGVIMTVIFGLPGTPLRDKADWLLAGMVREEVDKVDRKEEGVR